MIASPNENKWVIARISHRWVLGGDFERSSNWLFRLLMSTRDASWHIMHLRYAMSTHDLHVYSSCVPARALKMDHAYS